MAQNGEYAVEMYGITKTFGSVIANKDCQLQLKKGEILALLGENGSGKTTLMNQLTGIYFPDAGTIKVNGNEVSIRSPKDAFDNKIGMVHQHYLLVDVFSAAENIVLGMPGSNRLNAKEINASVKEIADKYGFIIDPKKKIYDMSVSEKQTVEIIKVLYRGADILILDEPTAVLTPQEVEKLFDVLRNMKNDGKSIIIITHKLHEVLAISDRVEILRHGEYIDTIETKEATAKILTDAMVGHAMELDLERPEVEKGKTILKVEDLTVLNQDNLKALDSVSFEAYGGEVLGIAGIAGSGQKELTEAIAGLLQIDGGSLDYYDEENGQEKHFCIDPSLGMAQRLSKIKAYGSLASFVPEDRLGMGLVASLGTTDNVLLRTYRKKKGIFTDKKEPKAIGLKMIDDLEIKTPGVDYPVRRLSGGNVQKVLFGREVMNDPKLLVVSYPTRGLDIMSSFKVYDLINEQKKKGSAVIYVGEDLDVLLQLCDRILVLCDGQVSGIVDARSVTKDEIGLLMIQVGNDGKEAKEA